MSDARGETAPVTAAFLDRDGVINVDKHYLHKIQDFEFLPSAVQAMHRLQAAGYCLVVVTNQSGIARGIYSEAEYEAVTAHMLADLAKSGVEPAAVLHCPHLPDAKVAAFRVACNCRKPAPGLLLQAKVLLDIDVGLSVLFGDKISDIAAGRAAGVKRCFLVRSGHTFSASDEAAADGVCADLAEGVGMLLTAEPK